MASEGETYLQPVASEGETYLQPVASEGETYLQPVATEGWNLPPTSSKWSVKLTSSQ